MSGYDCRNWWVFNLRRNVVSDGADWTSTGRLFQSRGPAVANERSPTVTSLDGGRRGDWRSTSADYLKIRVLDGSRSLTVTRYTCEFLTCHFLILLVINCTWGRILCRLWDIVKLPGMTTRPSLSRPRQSYDTIAIFKIYSFGYIVTFKFWHFSVLFAPTFRGFSTIFSPKRSHLSS